MAINIVFGLANRANYARCESVIKALLDYNLVTVHIAATSSMLLERYGSPINMIEPHPLLSIHRIFSAIEGETPETQAKTAGLICVEYSTLFASISPSLVVVVADRFEILPIAIAAAYQNIPVAHIQGGEISGNIDNKVRHAVSCLSDIHFPCLPEAESRLNKSVLTNNNIYSFGCPSMDLIDKKSLNRCSAYNALKYTPGTGKNVDSPSARYALCIFHPETEYFEDISAIAQAYLDTIELISHQLLVVLLWPNNDAGSAIVAKRIRVMREQGYLKNVALYKHFHPNEYLAVMANAEVLFGNSSSFLREGRHLGKPACLVGSRQVNRDLGSNVTKISLDDPVKAAADVLAHSKANFPHDHAYNNSGNAGKNIAETIIHFIKHADDPKKCQ